MTNSILPHLYSVITASSFIMALLLALVLFRTKTNQQLPYKLLSGLLVSCAMSVLLNAMLHRYLVIKHPNMHSLVEPFQLLIGPLLYFYISGLNKQLLTPRKRLLHCLPFIIVLVSLVIVILSDYISAVTNVFYFSKLNFLAFLVCGQIWFYYFLCRRALFSYRETLKTACSSLNKINQAWIEKSLLVLLIGYSAIMVIYLLNHGLYYLPVNKSMSLVLALVTFVIVYQTLRSPELLANENNELDKAEVKAKYLKSGLSDQQAQETYKQIQAYMLTSKAYKEPELNLNNLAEQLNISPHHLSQVINHQQGNNFYDFINNYRINEVKLKLLNEENADKSILTLAFSAGFNSKATFNRIFKEKLNITPSQYRKNK